MRRSEIADVIGQNLQELAVTKAGELTAQHESREVFFSLCLLNLYGEKNV